MRYAMLAAALLCGCNAFPTTIQKRVAVEKDAEGKVLKIIEEEMVIQRGAKIAQLKMVHFKEAEAPPPAKSEAPSLGARTAGGQANAR